MIENYSGFHLSRKQEITILSFSIITLLIHLYTNLFVSYGLIRDELYYIACSKRLSIGYVDQPPLSIYILTLSRWLFGESLFAIRLLPAISAAAMVYLTGLITARLGGKYIAIVIACITLTFSPVFLGMNSIFSMNSFDQFFWVLSAYFVIRIIQDNKPVYWILLGISLGLGTLNKISMIWFEAGFFAGLLFTPLRIHLKTIYPYLTAGIILIIFSPFIIWNFTHNFAHLEFIRNATNLKYSGLTPLDFIAGQLLLPGPFSIFIWLPGILYLFFSKEIMNYRMLGIIFLTTFIILILNWHTKAEYLASAYPIVFAGGGLFWERSIKGRNTNWIKYALILLIFLSGIISSPLVLPILPVKSFIKYSRVIGVSAPNSEHQKLEELPQHYADMFGWEDLARTVSSVYKTIPESEKQSTIVFASNYGEAGALEYYSAKYNLPRVVCPHNSYWYWGCPSKMNVKTVIVIGGKKKDHLKSCGSVTVAAIHRTEYCMPYENNLPIYICKDFSRSLIDIWQTSKFFI